MANRAVLRTLGVLTCAGLVWSATQSQWFYSLTTNKDITLERNYESSRDSFEDEKINLEDSDWKNSRIEFFNLPRVEVVLPEHEWINGYVPISKDPRVIYFWNRVKRTNDLERFKYNSRQIRRMT